MTQKRSFCTKAGGCVTGRIHGIVEAASALRTIASPFVVPGLLQTAEYTFELRRWSVVGFGGEYDDLVEQARQRRRADLQQAVFDRERPLQFWPVLDETIFLRTVTPDDVLHRQVAHLAKLAVKPNIKIQILPLRGESPLTHGFVLAEGSEGRTLICEEEEATIVTDRERPEIIDLAERHYARLASLALSPEMSAEILAERAAQPPQALRDPANMYRAVL